MTRCAVLCERDGPVAVVTLNRPEALNAMNARLRRALRETLQSVAEDAAVRAVVLTGAGRAFCAGVDVREFDACLQPGAETDIQTFVEACMRDDCNPIIRVLTEMNKPVIAAVRRPAVRRTLKSRRAGRKRA